MKARYSLRRLSSARAVLPPLEERRSDVKVYGRLLRRAVASLYAAARRDVLPRVTRDAMLHDDVSREDFDAIRRLAAALLGTLTPQVDDLIRAAGDRHTDRYVAQVKATLSIDLGGIIDREGLAYLLRQDIAANVGLAQSLLAATAEGIEDAVYRNLRTGGTAKALREELARLQGISSRRAALIARDQMATVNARMNRYRHEEAGITHYVWSTSRDERVRPLHRALDGKKYRYGENTGAENGAAPGEPVNCRCVARAVVE